MRSVFLATAEAVSPLLHDERVAAAWSSPSALDGFTVGALAGHLARAVETVWLYLEEPEPPDSGLVDRSRYFVGVGGPTTGADPAAIRARAEAAAAPGAVAVAVGFDERVAQLRDRLASERPDRRVATMQGTAPMSLDEYLPTRVIELVVHGDDLATSVGADPPRFPASASDVVIATLVGTARLRHGDLAVVRALTRRERDDIGALRVL